MRPGELIGLIVVVLLAILGVSLMFIGDIEISGPALVEQFETPEEAALFVALQTEFGSWNNPQIPEGMPGVQDNLRFGGGVWRAKCLHCHGASGGAGTPTGDLLRPRPRDLRSGVVKYTSTEAGWPATRTDLMRTITQGIPNTGMSAFDGIPEWDREALTDWTLYLMMRGQVWNDARREIRSAPETTPEAAIATAMEKARVHWGQANDHIVMPGARPAPDARSLQRGEELYRGEAGCVACHGADARGLPDSAEPLKDMWGQDVSPRDLRKGELQGPDWQGDLFRRLHAGIKGTPMPGVGNHLSDAQIWDLVSYVESLKE